MFTDTSRTHPETPLPTTPFAVLANLDLPQPIEQRLQALGLLTTEDLKRNSALWLRGNGTFFPFTVRQALQKAGYPLTF